MLNHVLNKDYQREERKYKMSDRIIKALALDGRVLITLADMQTRVAKTTLETLQSNYGGKIKIYNTIIPQGVKAVEGTMAGKSLYTYDKNSKPTIAYENFCKEVLKDEKQRIKNEFDNEAIGIILCTSKKGVTMEYALGGLSNNIFASTYTYYIPNRDELIHEVEKVLNGNDIC